MSITGTLLSVLSDWSGVPVKSIKDLDEELCVLLARGRALDCDNALSALIPSLKKALPNRVLGGLRVKDMKTGKLKTIQLLLDFISNSGKNN